MGFKPNLVTWITLEMEMEKGRGRLQQVEVETALEAEGSRCCAVTRLSRVEGEGGEL